jgi:hypothetical protein
MTLIDLRLEYKRDTGDGNTPINHGYYGDVRYILWLEEKLLEQTKKKEEPIFIPFTEMTDEELFNLSKQ